MNVQPSLGSGQYSSHRQRWRSGPAYTHGGPQVVSRWQVIKWQVDGSVGNSNREGQAMHGCSQFTSRPVTRAGGTCTCTAVSTSRASPCLRFGGRQEGDAGRGLATVAGAVACSGHEAVHHALLVCVQLQLALRTHAGQQGVSGEPEAASRHTHSKTYSCIAFASSSQQKSSVHGDAQLCPAGLSRTHPPPHHHPPAKRLALVVPGTASPMPATSMRGV